MRIKPSRRWVQFLPVALGMPLESSGRVVSAVVVPAVARNVASLPFVAGERLTYGVKLSAFNAGSTVMTVDTAGRIRGIPAYRTVFDLKARILFKRYENHCESWIDRATGSSLHQMQTLDGTTKSYDFFGDRKVYVRDGEEHPSVAEPLDECAFLFFLRSIPLEVGKTYTFDRYYHAEKNPITITVDKRERMKVAAGEFDAILVRPVIKSNGMFSEAAQAEVWIATEGSRPILRLKSKLSLGTLYLELKDMGPKP